VNPGKLIRRQLFLHDIADDGERLAGFEHLVGFYL
jgi:hypothetical protein